MFTFPAMTAAALFIMTQVIMTRKMAKGQQKTSTIEK